MIKLENCLSCALTLSIFASTALGCDVPDDTPIAEATELRDYEAEDLFRGIVLGYGPVAELIPEVRNHLALADAGLSDDDLANAEADLDVLVDEMAELDPAFFAEFEAAVHSGDAPQLAAMLDRSGPLMTEATERLDDLRSAATDPAAATAPGSGTTTSSVVGPFLYNIFHKQVTVIVCLYVPVVVSHVLPQSEQASLVREQLIDRVAEMARAEH